MAAPITGPLADLFPDTLMVERVTGTDEAGDETYGTPEPIPCKLNRGDRMVSTGSGREVPSTIQATIAGVFGLSVKDRYTFPADFEDGQATALTVDRPRDENGPHHEVVSF